MRTTYFKPVAIFTALALNLFCACTFAFTDEDRKTLLRTGMFTLEQHFNEGNVDEISKTLDFDAILQTSMEGIEVDEGFKTGFIQGFKKSTSMLASKLVNIVSDGGHVKLVNHQIYKTHAEGLYRFDQGENGLTYMRFSAKNIDGQMRIVDWFDYAKGQKYTQSIATVFRAIAPSKGFMGKIKDIASNKMQDLSTLVEFSKLVREAKYAELKTFFNKADEKTRNNWIIMSGLVQAASASGDENHYKKVLGSVAQNFADDPRAGFVLIDYYFYQQQYAKVIPVLEMLAKQFGQEDAGLLYLKSNTYFMMGDIKLAKKAASDCVSAEGNYEPCYWNLVSFTVGDKQYTEVIAHLKTLERIFGYRFEKANFQNDEFYQEFVQSDVFNQWFASKLPEPTDGELIQQ